MGNLVKPGPELVSPAFMAKAQEVLAARLVSVARSRASSRGLYALPVRKADLIAVAHDRSPAHVGGLSNSIDFYVDEGTAVFAAETGRVIFARGNNQEHGIDLSFWNKGNLVVIQHGNGELTDYEHLAHRSVSVRVGQHVAQGELIARSGNTGFTENPHLHFSVLRRLPGASRRLDYRALVSVKARFIGFPSPYIASNYADVLRDSRHDTGSWL